MIRKINKTLKKYSLTNNEIIWAFSPFIVLAFYYLEAYAVAFVLTSWITLSSLTELYNLTQKK